MAYILIESAACRWYPLIFTQPQSGVDSQHGTADVTGDVNAKETFKRVYNFRELPWYAPVSWVLEEAAVNQSVGSLSSQLSGQSKLTV